MKPGWLPLLLFAACRSGTSVLVTVDARDLAVPDQVAALRVRVTNPEIDSANATYDSQRLALCRPGETASCYGLPLSVTLRPGDAQAQALVRVEVIALDSAGAEVVHDAARFRFSDGETQSVDFHLSPSCLKTYCAAQERVCGVNGGCVDSSTVGAEARDAASPVSPGVVETWFQAAGGSPEFELSLSLPRPANAKAGDLLVAMAPAGRFPAGWTILASAPRIVLASHRVEDGESPSGYVITDLGASAPNWMEISYRGVTQVEVGSSANSAVADQYTMRSLDVAREGALLTTWISTSYAAPCTYNGAPGTYPGDYIKVFEAPNLKVGPTGTRLYECAGALPMLAAELLLSP